MDRQGPRGVSGYFLADKEKGEKGVSRGFCKVFNLSCRQLRWANVQER